MNRLQGAGSGAVVAMAGRTAGSGALATKGAPIAVSTVDHSAATAEPEVSLSTSEEGPGCPSISDRVASGIGRGTATMTAAVCSALVPVPLPLP